MRDSKIIKIPFTNASIKQSILVVYVLSVLDNVAFFSQLFGLSFIIKKRLDVSDALIGYSQTLYGVLEIVGGPLFGAILHKLGIRTGLFLTYGLTATMAATFYFINNVYGLFLSKLPGLLIHGMLAHQAIISHLTEPGKERTTAFGRLALCFGISVTLAPLANGFFAKIAGDFACLYSSAFFSVLAAVIAAVFINPEEFSNDDTVDEDGNASKANSKPLTLASVVDVVLRPKVFFVLLQKHMAWAPVTLPLSMMNLYLIEKFAVTEQDNGYVQMTFGILMMVVNGFGIPFLRARFTENKLVYIGIGALLVCHSQYSHLVYYPQVYFILPFLAIGMTLVNTVSDSVLTASVNPDEHAIILGCTTAAASFFRTIAPSLGGYIMDAYGFHYIGYIGATCTLIAAGIGLLVPYKHFEEKKEL
uniref:MFS domain-containing protein n=1 Tax=Panagrellus redivivus TaxID=6233 RepID=A0A7E4VRB1_PANRE